MSDLTYLEIDPRMYKFIRQSAITNLEDAFVEIITNSIDAYTGLNKECNRIDIEINYVDRFVKVTDYAIGLSAQDIKNKIFKVGRQTSSHGKRGYFSRGAKDISAIGNIFFESIFDLKYSKGFINTEGQCSLLVNNQEVTGEIRTETGIMDCGTAVTILFKDTLIVNKQDILQWNLENHYALHDILNIMENKIYLNNILLQTIKYDGKLIVDLEYQVSNYPDAIIKFELYRVNEPIPEPMNERYLRFGILISSDTTVYECSCLYNVLRYNPAMPYLYGRIHCPYIDTLMYQIDENGENDSNPFPIIDHSRINGLNKNHPFTQALFSIPYQRLNYILNKLNDELNPESFQPENLKDFLSDFEVFSANLLEEYHHQSKPKIDHARIINKQTKNNVIIEKSNLEYSNDNIQQNKTSTNKLSFKIQFVDRPMKSRYVLFRSTDSLVLQINQNDPGFQNFWLSEKQKFDWSREGIRVLIADIILEALSKNVVEQQLIRDNAQFNGLNPIETLNTIFQRYDKTVNKIKNDLYAVLFNNLT